MIDAMMPPRTVRFMVVTLVAALVVILVVIMVSAACEDDSLPEPTAVAPVITPPTVLVVSPTSTPTPIPTATPTPPSAADILRRMTAAMKEVQSALIQMRTISDIEGNSNLSSETNVSGRFQLPDRTQATMSINTQGVTLRFEFIAIGAELYMRKLLAGEWEASLDEEETPANFLAGPVLRLDFPSDKAAQFELVGIESLDRESVYYLRAHVPGSDLAELIDDRNTYVAGGQVEYWVGVDDYLVRKMEIFTEQESDDIGINVGMGTITTHLVFELSAYNLDVNIVAPEVEAR